MQTLGRLNRPAPHLGKSASSVAVYDFANTVGSIRESFEEYYSTTTYTTGSRAQKLRLEVPIRLTD